MSAMFKQSLLNAATLILLPMLLLSGCQQAGDTATEDSDAAAETTTAAVDYPPAPAFSLRNSDGAEISFPRADGSTDIYFFWATWCPYCKQLMPHLQSIVDEYDGRVTVTAINIRENGKPQVYLDNNGYGFELFPEGDAVAALYGIKGTPGLIVVDDEGRLRFDMNDLLAPSNKALEGLKHGQRARRIAPWWAAQLRLALDEIAAG